MQWSGTIDANKEYIVSLYDIFKRIDGNYMKHKFILVRYKLLVGFIALLGLSFTTNVYRANSPQRVNSKVLLIECSKEAIWDYQRMKYRLPKYVSGTPVTRPYYDSDLKTLDIEHIFKLSDSAKIIFCDEKAIEISLPFHYSDIVIDRLINDSVLQFTFQNRKHILKPGQIFNDTIISYEHDGKKLLKCATIYKIQNHGPISKENIVDLDERKKRHDEENKIRDSIEIKRLLDID